MDFPNIASAPYLALDTETTGLQYLVDKPFAASISLPEGGGSYYWDFRLQPEAVSWLRDEIKRYRGIIICHNASFDYRMLYSIGVCLPIDQLDDTQIRASVIDEHLFSYRLGDLGKKYLGREKIKIDIKNIANLPIEEAAPYAIRDTDLTLDLWEWQNGEIDRQDERISHEENKLRRAAEYERDKMPTFIRAEMRGIKVDTDYAEEAADKITPIIDEKQNELNKIAGWDFNTNSSPQVKKYFAPSEMDGEFFVGDTLIGKTPKGKPSLGAEYLRDIKDPAAGLILEIRSLLKTRDTFLRGHVIAHNVNGRVYPTINQTKGDDGGTGTGRLSYQNPAMQQIPSRNKKVAAIVKPCFLPDDGMTWVDSDMASFEVRVFYHLINNPTINALYAADPEKDAHQFVADLTGLNRNAEYSGQANAKQLNLSMIFNSGNGAIADKMGMSWEWRSFVNRQDKKITYKKAGTEAEAIIALYHREIRGVKELADGCKSQAERVGYIRNFMGQRLRFPNGYKSYSASGLLIQSTAAQINKRNWKVIEDVLGDRGNLILNTHDSYSMGIQEDWEPVYKEVKREVENFKFNVPLILDLNGAGPNWWAALQGVS